MTELYADALDELKAVFTKLDDASVDAAVDDIASARRVVLFGCGRERLQVMGFCMRLFHMGLDVAMEGDMTTPPVGPGDLFIATVGPGELSTASALLGVAKTTGARTLVVTAKPDGASCKIADRLVAVPAQTMANDLGDKTSVLPMGSLFEGALFVLFEVMVLKLMAAKHISYEDMRSRHTNLE